MRENVRKLGVRYPVALDNDFVTWQSWHNQYWPAKYLIDKRGHVRYYHFGEGEYARDRGRDQDARSAPTRRRRPALRTRARTGT